MKDGSTAISARVDQIARRRVPRYTADAAAAAVMPGRPRRKRASAVDARVGAPHRRSTSERNSRDARGVAHLIERKEVRIREPRRQRRPDARELRVAAEAGIDARDPRVRVERGVVDAVGALEAHVHNRHADEVEEARCSRSRRRCAVSIVDSATPAVAATRCASDGTARAEKAGPETAASTFR
jgi:hypothetical protein